MYEWTEEQEMVRGAVRQFIDKEIPPNNEQFEHPDEVMSTAVEHLQVASCDADELGLHIQQAHCAVAHLYQ